MPSWSLAIACAVVVLVPPPARAQDVPSHRTAVLDLTMARHAVNGGFIDYRNGAMLDVLAAGTVRSSPRAAFIAAVGAGVVVGGFSDRCLSRPDGGCAPLGNFVVTNVLAGADLSLGQSSMRVLLGPALYNGAGASSLGAQVRLDLISPPLVHVGIGPMLRATVLPSHGGDLLVAWAVGGSLVIR